MRVLGIIAEYDPIHNGHMHHLLESRKMCRADFSVAVMSGDLTQRGEPAMLDKWTRAEMAVRSGIDLVIELPAVYATGSAEIFCRGGVQMLRALGCVTDMSFGSEAGDLEILTAVASLLGEEPDAYRRILRRFLDEGRTFPKARELAVKELLGEAAARVMLSPNNILAIEYLKALRTLGGGIRPHTVKRQGAGHDSCCGLYDMDGGTSVSASMIRHAVTGFSAMQCEAGTEKKQAQVPAQEESRTLLQALRESMPQAAADILIQHMDAAADPAVLWPFIRARILQSDPAVLATAAGVTEGIEHRLLRFIRSRDNFEDYVDAVRSGRYTRGAVKRMLLHILLGMRGEDIAPAPACLRVLAMNRQGRLLLRRIHDTGCAKVPVVTNINKLESLRENRMLGLDILAADIYNLATGRNLYRWADQVKMPYVEQDE